MNESQMESFVAAVECGSLGKAAKEQYLTVPSLAHRINTLESELGYRVLVRSQHGVSPTPEGERLYHACKQALSILAQAKGGAKAAPDAAAHTITVGVWWRIPPYFIKAIDSVDPQGNGIYLDFVSLDFNEAARGFEQHEIDLYLSVRSRELDERKLRYTPLTRMQYHGVFSPASHLADRSRLSAKDLEGFTVYAGADYRNMPELAACSEVQDLFAMDNVVKESIFVQKLIQDCAQSKAVAFFGSEVDAEEVDYAEELSQLASRPMDWPIVTSGIYMADDASPETMQFVEDLARACRAGKREA